MHQDTCLTNLVQAIGLLKPARPETIVREVYETAVKQQL